MRLLDAYARLPLLVQGVLLWGTLLPLFFGLIRLNLRAARIARAGTYTEVKHLRRPPMK